MPSNKPTLTHCVTSLTLHLINGNQEMTRISCTLKVTQQGTLVPQPYCSPETPHVADSLLLQRPFTTTIMNENNVVVAAAGPTLTSAQVALIAMGIVACFSFILAVYIWSRSLLNQRRERSMLDDTTTAAGVAAEEHRYRQQHYAHDYARSTIHDTSPLQQPAYTNNTAYFTHNGLPLPPTYKSKN